MKIAVQLFGHLRTYDKCAGSLRKYLLNRYDCDVFAHTWSTLDHNTQTWHRHKMRTSPICSSEIKARLKRQWGDRVKQVLVETQEYEDRGGITTVINADQHEISVFGVCGMFHSMAEANRLREEYAKQRGIDYDFVVCVRPDILLKKRFDIEEHIRYLSAEEIARGFFTVGNALTATVRGLKDMGMTDVLFFARPRLMSDVFAARSQFTAKLKAQKIVDHGPEYFLIEMVEELGYAAYVLQYGFNEDFEILRPVTSRNLRKGLLRVRMRKSYLRLRALEMCIWQIIRFRLDLFGAFQIDICVGNPNDSTKG